MKNDTPEPVSEPTPASLIRRLAAISYDSLLCLALMMFTTGLYMLISYLVIGEANYRALNESGATMKDPLLSSILFVTLFLFFGYFWTKTGQTLGMQVWHLRLRNSNDTNISWTQALLRFLMAGLSAAAFGLGYFWILVDRDKRSWQCLFSNSEIVRLPKKP